MKKILLLSAILCLTLSVLAFDYVPKNAGSNPFTTTNRTTVQKTQPNEQGMREITNLNEYFRYLPREVQRNWVPYKSNTNYEVTVQFRVNRDGSISETKIVKSTNPSANSSVLNAVKIGAPYQPLPASYPNKEGVVAQVILEYRAK